MILDVNKVHSLCLREYMLPAHFIARTKLNYRTAAKIFSCKEKGLPVRARTLYKIAEGFRISPNTITLGAETKTNGQK